ncbi:MAG: PKD domain-containing protein, partial [Myxococcota bacterium]
MDGGSASQTVTVYIGSGCMTTETGTSGAITLSNVPSRLSGVAPLSVFFDATGTTATATTAPFHELEYRWDFGDPVGSPVSGTTWSTGSRAGVSKRNEATGPVTAHVYETPGTYYVSVTVTDETNTAANSCTQIVVEDPDVVFAGTSTICIGATTLPVAGVDGCPTGADVATQPEFGAAVNDHVATHKRILFKHDDVFTGTTGVDVSVTGPGLIGMYGTGARPVFRAGAGTGTIVLVGTPSSTTMEDWRIMDLELDGQSAPAITGFSANGNLDRTTLLRLDIHDAASLVMFNIALLKYYADAYDIHVFEQNTIVDCTLNRAVGGAGQCVAFVSGNHFAILGNLANDSTGAEHVMRIQHAAKAVVSNNTFDNPAPTKQAFTLRGVSFTDYNCNQPTGTAQCIPDLFPYGSYSALTSQTVVADNHFISGDTAQPVTVQPSDANYFDTRFQDIILERNWYTATPGGCCLSMLVIQAQDVTVRNELLDMTNGTWHRGISVEEAGTAS